MLRERGLLVPSDYYYKIKQPFVPMPKDKNLDSHLKSTQSMTNRAKSGSYSNRTILPSISPVSGANYRDFDYDYIKPGSESSEGESEQEDCDSNKFLKSTNELAKQSQVTFTDSDKPKTKTKSIKKRWKDSLSQEARTRQREELKKFEMKTKFLPNPRLDAIRLAQV
jgi:hypothetical protein